MIVVRCTIVVHMSIFPKVYQWPPFPYAESMLKSLQQSCMIYVIFFSFLSFNHRHITTGAVLLSIWTAAYCIARRTLEAVGPLLGNKTVLSSQFCACYSKSKQKKEKKQRTVLLISNVGHWCKPDSGCIYTASCGQCVLMPVMVS